MALLSVPIKTRTRLKNNRHKTFCDGWNSSCLIQKCNLLFSKMSLGQCCNTNSLVNSKMQYLQMFLQRLSKLNIKLPLSLKIKKSFKSEASWIEHKLVKKVLLFMICMQLIQVIFCVYGQTEDPIDVKNGM